AGGRAAAHPEPVHLFLSLIQEEEGRAALLLAGAGLAPAAARQALAERPAAAAQPPAGLPPHGELTEQALGGARALAYELTGERTGASEHLLLAALRAGTTLPRAPG